MEASKEGRSLTDFRYACVGYSLYPDRKKQVADGQEKQTELPVCFGLEVSVSFLHTVWVSFYLPHRMVKINVNTWPLLFQFLCLSLFNLKKHTHFIKCDFFLFFEHFMTKTNHKKTSSFNFHVCCTLVHGRWISNAINCTILDIMIQ